MSYRPSPPLPDTTSDIHAGCLSNLFRDWWKRRQRSPPVDLDTTRQVSRNHLAGAPALALPSYAHVAHGWYGCYTGEECFATKSTEHLPAYVEEKELSSVVLDTIQRELKDLSPELRNLSLDIWNHPEVMYEERYAHDRLTAFMVAYGFKVTPHYLGLETAWRAEYTHVALAAEGKASDQSRVIGVNSEMDALPGVGHACGHNLIAMSGVAVALAIKAALEKHDVSGTIILLGTPAEEASGGKITLLQRGAYKEMNACIMSHPTSGPKNLAGIWPGVACQPIDVEFYGHGAHAAAAPWEAQNALDAAFIAYGSISALRQQIKPDHRVHGIVGGRDWAPNVIPDYAKMQYIVRAPTWVELETLRERVMACFQAAALATGCRIETALGSGYFELKHNVVLGKEFAEAVGDMYDMRTDIGEGVKYSTDFGNVTYALPALHPAYSIPTEPNGSNHTPQFAKSAATQEAHEATLKVAAGLAAVGFKVLQDAEFAHQVKTSFESS